MSWHYSQAWAEEYLGASSQGTESSAPWRKSRTAERCCSEGSATACYPCSQSGTTSEPSTVENGVARWISSLRDSHASRSASPASNEEPTTSETSGRKPSASFARYDHRSHCWRTSQGCLDLTGTSDEYSETWPKAGWMLGGTAYHRQSRARLSRVDACGLLPTLTVSDSKGGRSLTARRSRPELAKHGITLPDWILLRGNHAPVPRAEFAEEATLFPVGWTDLGPLEMHRFRQWWRAFSRESTRE